MEVLFFKGIEAIRFNSIDEFQDFNKSSAWLIAHGEYLFNTAIIKHLLIDSTSLSIYRRFGSMPCRYVEMAPSLRTLNHISVIMPIDENKEILLNSPVYIIANNPGFRKSIARLGQQLSENCKRAISPWFFKSSDDYSYMAIEKCEVDNRGLIALQAFCNAEYFFFTKEQTQKFIRL